MKLRFSQLYKRLTPNSEDAAPAEHPAVREARLRQTIGIAVARYFIMGQRTADVAIPFEDVALDSMAEWIPHVLERPELSEPEFAVFAFVRDRAATVLDIGAHYGYSAASIWRAGSPAHVLSFEPNPWQHEPLQRIKELRPEAFDFIGMGLSNAQGSLRFVLPVVDGKGIGGLGTAAIERELDWAIPENLVHYMNTYTPEVASPRLQFAETQWSVAPLDAMLASANVAVPLERIDAIKIDVEGLEPEVLEGAEQTLRRHRPWLMIEGANRIPDVVQRLAPLGYRYAEFAEGRVSLTNERSTRVSGFYLHESRLDEYRASGMLIARASSHG